MGGEPAGSLNDDTDRDWAEMAARAWKRNILPQPPPAEQAAMAMDAPAPRG